MKNMFRKFLQSKTSKVRKTPPTQINCLILVKDHNFLTNTQKCFYAISAKELFIRKRNSPKLQESVSYLTIRVKGPDMGEHIEFGI